LSWLNKHHHFWLGFAAHLPNFAKQKSKTGHEVTQMGHQELFTHQNITHWIHMEEMKWFSSN
jgi:hypothetical protein